MGVVSVLCGDGEVSLLTAVNSGQKPVLLAVGDVEGGRQDRDCLDLLVPQQTTRCLGSLRGTST